MLNQTQTEELRAEKAREAVRRWYRQHRDEYSDERKRRYRTDKKRRDKARKAAASYRKARKKGHAISRTLHRDVNGVQVEVFSTGMVADESGCSSQALRNWETKGYIPPSIFPDRHRLYTRHQVELIKLLVNAMTVGDYGLRTRKLSVAQQSIIDSTVEYIHKTWGIPDDNTVQEPGNRKRVSRKKRAAKKQRD